MKDLLIVTAQWGGTEDVLSLLGNTDKVLLLDFEILFAPRYRLNVLRTFGTITHFWKLVVKWCEVYTRGQISGECVQFLRNRDGGHIEDAAISRKQPERNCS
jgi:hypothetical protein